MKRIIILVLLLMSTVTVAAATPYQDPIIVVFQVPEVCGETITSLITPVGNFWTAGRSCRRYIRFPIRRLEFISFDPVDNVLEVEAPARAYRRFLRNPYVLYIDSPPTTN